MHELKIWPEFFEPVLRGDKTAELRYNDRRYEVGDILILQEWEPRTREYTGREVKRLVSHVQQGMGMQGVIEPLRGLDRRYAILSLQEIVDVELWRAA
jgi:hypothetical protein